MPVLSRPVSTVPAHVTPPGQPTLHHPEFNDLFDVYGPDADWWDLVQRACDQEALYTELGLVPPCIPAEKETYIGTFPCTHFNLTVTYASFRAQL